MKKLTKKAKWGDLCQNGPPLKFFTQTGFTHVSKCPSCLQYDY